MPILDHVMGTGAAGEHARAILGGGKTGLVATGSTQADALQLTDSWAVLTTSNASTGIILPKTSGTAFGGIRNDSGQTITVYPPGAGTINAGASSFSFANTKTLFWFAASPTVYAIVLTA